MPRARPGEVIGYVVTHLEMTARPTALIPPMPAGPALALIGAADPPPDYFLYLYRTVGDGHEWTDWLRRPRAELEDFLSAPEVELFTLMLDGWPGGFFVLDGREPGRCDLAYFGLVPQAVGRGLSGWFLGTAIHIGWDRLGAGRLTVNTNTLDHPRALALYQKMGFVPVSREEKTRRPGRARGS